ncbi:hypothetical protein D3C75_1256780 [compost metagenome]
MSLQLKHTIKETVFHYVKGVEDTTNLLGVTSVRNVIYILTDLEKKLSFQINDSFITEIKNCSIENLEKIIPGYLK